MAETVGSILQTQLKIPAESLTPDLAINGVWQWDSLAHLELMMYLEERHGVVVTEESIIECASVDGLCKVLGLDL